MDTDEDLKSLQETLREAHKARSTAHIGHEEAGRGADAIQRTVDKLFDQDVEKNRSEGTDYGVWVRGHAGDCPRDR